MGPERGQGQTPSRLHGQHTWGRVAHLHTYTLSHTFERSTGERASLIAPHGQLGSVTGNVCSTPRHSVSAGNPQPLASDCLPSLAAHIATRSAWLLLASYLCACIPHRKSNTHAPPGPEAVTASSDTTSCWLVEHDTTARRLPPLGAGCCVLAIWVCKLLGMTSRGRRSCILCYLAGERSGVTTLRLRLGPQSAAHLGLNNFRPPLRRPVP